MKLKKLLIVGAQGSGVIAATVFEEINEAKPTWDICGYLNDVAPPGTMLGKYPIVGSSEEVLDYVQKGYYIHYTFHFNVKKKEERVRKFRDLQLPDEAMATGVHPRAYLNPTSTIGPGSLLLPNTATSAEARIGKFCHVYTNGFVGHESELSDYSTLAAHAVIGARIKMGEGVHIGLNSCIREDVQLGKYCIVGMGTVVLKDVPDYGIIVGNPGVVKI